MKQISKIDPLNGLVNKYFKNAVENNSKGTVGAIMQFYTIDSSVLRKAIIISSRKQNTEMIRCLSSELFSSKESIRPYREDFFIDIMAEASTNGKCEVVKCLCELIDTRTKQYVIDRNNIPYFRAIRMAASRNHVNIMQYLLEMQPLIPESYTQKMLEQVEEMKGKSSLLEDIIKELSLTKNRDSRKLSPLMRGSIIGGYTDFLRYIFEKNKNIYDMHHCAEIAIKCNQGSVLSLLDEMKDSFKGDCGKLLDKATVRQIALLKKEGNNIRVSSTITGVLLDRHCDSRGVGFSLDDLVQSMNVSVKNNRIPVVRVLYHRHREPLYPLVSMVWRLLYISGLGLNIVHRITDILCLDYTKALDNAHNVLKRQATVKEKQSNYTEQLMKKGDISKVERKDRGYDEIFESIHLR